jgi:hypothetical protein
MGLFDIFRQKPVPEYLINKRFKPFPGIGTRASSNYATIFSNIDYKFKDPIKWMRHTERSEQSRLLFPLKDQEYRVVEVRDGGSLGEFYRVLVAAGGSSKSGVWVSAQDLVEVKQ